MPLVFPGLLVGGAIFFVGIFLVMLSQASSSSVRPAAESSSLQTILTAPLHLLTQVWHRLVRATYSRFAAAHLIPLVRWFSSANALLVLTSRTFADAADEQATAVERMRHTVIPRVVSRRIAPVRAQAKAASRSAANANAHATATSKALTTYRTHTNTTLRRHTHQLTYTIPREVQRIRAREEGLSRDVESLRNRARSLENGAIKTFRWIIAHRNSIVTGVFAGAVSVALDRLGYKFFKCRSWRKLGSRLTCGMGSLLEDLVFGAFTALAVTDLCAFADGMETLARQLQPLFLKLVDVEDALIGCHGATAPDLLGLPRLYLPPVPDPLPLG